MAYRSSNLKNFSESSAKLSKDEIIEVGGEDMLYEVGFCANHLEFAKILLARGISPNKKSIYGRTGLHHLGINGNKEMYDLYVANGANETIVDELGFTPKEYLLRSIIKDFLLC